MELFNGLLIERQIILRRGGGGGALNKAVYGEALPQGPKPYPFIYHF